MITVGADPGEFKFRNSHRKKRIHQNIITNENDEEKSGNFSKLSGAAEILQNNDRSVNSPGNKKEEQSGLALSPEPIYRGSGVKYCITALSKLERNVDRMQRAFSPQKRNKVKEHCSNMEEEMGQEREYKKERPLR